MYSTSSLPHKSHMETQQTKKMITRPDPESKDEADTKADDGEVSSQPEGDLKEGSTRGGQGWLEF